MKPGSISGQFVGPSGRRIFVLRREPREALGRDSVLFIPPFGEEMNKSRRLMTETAEQFCRQGLPVFLPDFFGTGDSEGEFRDATVERWLEDIESTCRHAASLGQPIRAVVAVRLGCALAAAAARRGALPALAASAWWQPVIDGKRFVTQFLRLRVAAVAMRGDTGEAVESLRARSTAGKMLEVAGYELTPELLSGLDGLSIDSLPPQSGDLHWYEIVREVGGAPSLPTTRFVDRARASGASVGLRTLPGEPFWASTEIVRLPLLAELTSAAVGRSLATSDGRSPPESLANA